MVFQRIQEGYTVYCGDFGICGFEFAEKGKNYVWISVLKLLINLWTGNWQEYIGKIKTNIRL